MVSVFSSVDSYNARAFSL